MTRSWMICSMIGALPTGPTFEGIRVLGTRWSPRSYDFMPGFSGAQPRSLSVDRRRAFRQRSGNQALAGCARAGRTPACRSCYFPHGTKLLESVPDGRGSKGWIAHARANELLRPGDRGRRAGGSCCRCLRRVRGLAHGDDRARSSGRPGRDEFAQDGELSWISRGLSGGDLARRAVVQAQRLGVEILAPQETVGVRTEDPYRIVKMADGNEISCHALLMTTGVQWRRLDAPGIDRLQGAGVYYGGGATEAFVVQGRNRLRDRRREFGGPGGHEFREVRRARGDRGARRALFRARCRSI